MKMVDGSTVRHGRADCSYPERASRCGGHSDRHTGAVGAGGKESRRDTVMKRREKEKGMMEEGVNYPLGCSEKVEKSKKSTAGRNL